MYNANRELKDYNPDTPEESPIWQEARRKQHWKNGKEIVDYCINQ